MCMATDTAVNIATIAVNIVIALIYAFILWVMVQQRWVMTEQQRTMTQQLEEMRSARVSAHRPVLIVQTQIQMTTWRRWLLRAAVVETAQLRNIGAGPALNVRVVYHSGREKLFEILLPPIAVQTLSEPVDLYRELETTAVYEDIFGNTYWTHYSSQQHFHHIGVGEPTHFCEVSDDGPTEGDGSVRQQSIWQVSMLHR